LTGQCGLAGSSVRGCVLPLPVGARRSPERRTGVRTPRSPALSPQ